MARDLGKPGDVKITLHSVDLPLLQHGLVVQDGSVAEVIPGSPAERAGVQVGDILARVGGQSVLHCSDDTVRALMAQRPLSLQLGRPHPPPCTLLEKRKALGALQAKLDSGAEAQTVQSYKAAVGSALLAAQDVLGSLGLEPEPLGVGQAVQEVEVNCYDSDSLSSPPASSGEESEGEIDPLLDFSREDEFTHHPGKPMIYNVLKTQQALGGLKAITHDILEAKQQKAAEERQRAKPLVATEASFTPTFKGGMPTQPRAMPELKLPQKSKLAKQLPSVTIQQQSRTGGAPAQVSRIQPKVQPDMLAEQLPSIATQQQSKTGSTSPPPAPVSRMEPRAEPEIRRPQNPQPLPNMQPNRKDITTQQRNKSSPPPAEVSRREPSPREDIPPSVPPYNPHGPERHVWSDKPRERPQPARVLPLRGRKKSGEHLPTTEMLGHITDGVYKKRSFSPPPPVAIQPTLPESVHDWQMEEVGVWLKRLELYEKYFTLFCKHDITGPTVMRLNESKLKSMGITHRTHRQLLAVEAARLKIQQEALELRELEDETEITYL